MDFRTFSFVRNRSFAVRRGALIVDAPVLSWLQFAAWMPCSMPKPTKPSLDEQRWYASEVEAVPQFCCWYAVSASNM